MKTINIIGCGKVGRTLGHLLRACGTYEIQDLLGTNIRKTERAAEFIQAGRAVATLQELRPADFWLLTVPDTLIRSVASELAYVLQETGTTGDAQTAIHCSGFLPASALDPLRGLGFQVASAHPVLTFANPASAISGFPGTPCGLEGETAALSVVRPLLEAIGCECFPVQTALKPLYHAAAVFASNFTVVLQAVAREAWCAAGVPEDLASKIQASLLHATVDNVLTMGPRAITGPAARGDSDVVRLQGAEVFRWHPDAGVLYQDLSRLARRLALHESTLADQELNRPGF